MSTISPGPVEPLVSPGAVVVRRWKRYGHDRAYVAVDGVDVGYRDLANDAVVCSVPGHDDTIAAVTEGLAARARAARYRPRHAADDDPATPALPAAHATQPARPGRVTAHAPTLQPDVDLAANKPGQSVRAQADALRAEAPVRTALLRVLNVHTDERSYRIGAEAEAEVARRLAKLGPAWRVLHSIPVGERGNDIDHVVIGPGGVFTINTKNHPSAHIWVRGDTFKMNGHNQDYVRNSRYEAARAAKLLRARLESEVDVRGLIAVMGATGGFMVKEQPADGRVVIVKRKEVARYLTSLPVQLDAATVDAVYSVARHLATWQPNTVAWQEF